MKIAFDLDGTAWKYREVFSKLAHILKKGGAVVGILTAHEPRLTVRDQELWVARKFPKADFYICRHEHEHDITAKDWKKKMVQDHNIDLLIDDMHDFKDVYVIINERYSVR